jgi:hypothetical protein
MLPDVLHNPETAAIGLDVAALEGKSIAEVRRIVDRDDCALVIATENVPPRLPPEVMVKEPNVYEGKPSLSWMYQTDGGDWRDWSSYVVDADYVRRGGEPPTEIVFGQLYTKQARATPGMRVRPIATLNFDPNGVCISASDAEPQFDILRIRSAERLTALRTSPSAKARVAPARDPLLETLVRPFGLVAPAEGIVLEDWRPDDPRTGLFVWGNECELRSLILWNAQMDQRVAIGREDGGAWWLMAIEGATTWPAITLDERGLRVNFRSPAGDEGPAFDVYADRSDVRIIDVDGTAFAASILIAQRSPPVAPMKVEPAIQILAHRQEESARKETVTARLPSDQRMNVTSASGTTSFNVIAVNRVPATGAILIFARPA